MYIQVCIWLQLSLMRSHVHISSVTVGRAGFWPGTTSCVFQTRTLGRWLSCTNSLQVSTDDYMIYPGTVILGLGLGGATRGREGVSRARADIACADQLLRLLSPCQGVSLGVTHAAVGKDASCQDCLDA